jgi:CheY-like chemotaxis protein
LKGAFVLSERKKILIIDDEAYIRRVVELKLAKRGYEVVGAANGEEGLRIFEDLQPDVVITDINMPKLNGKAFCELTNGMKKQRPFLTIIITCSIADDCRKWVKDLNETLFFDKPFSPSKLSDSIDAYFCARQEQFV